MPKAPRNADYFAQIPESVVLRLRCGNCLRLYTYLDIRQGMGTWAVQGITKITEELVWQPRTVKKHLRHLSEVRLVKLDPPPKRSWSKTETSVTHNPARKRSVALVEVPDVFESDTEQRWKQKSSGPEVLAELSRRTCTSSKLAAPHSERDEPKRSHVGRDASYVNEPTERVAPSDVSKARRANSQGGARPIEPRNAARTTPSVSGYKAMKGGSAQDGDIEESEDNARAARNGHLRPAIDGRLTEPDSALSGYASDTVDALQPCRTLDCVRPADGIEGFCKLCEPF